MTDKVKGFTVTLEEDIRVDDVEIVLNALKMIKYVAHVEPSISTSDDHFAEQRLRWELRDKLVLHTTNSNMKRKIMDKKVKIELDEYYYDCGEGCCTNYGTTTTVNGKELDSHNQDVATILQQVLTELGYEVEIIETYNGE